MLRGTKERDSGRRQGDWRNPCRKHWTTQDGGKICMEPIQMLSGHAWSLCFLLPPALTWPCPSNSLKDFDGLESFTGGFPVLSFTWLIVVLAFCSYSGKLPINEENLFQSLMSQARSPLFTFVTNLFSFYPSDTSSLCLSQCNPSLGIPEWNALAARICCVGHGYHWYMRIFVYIIIYIYMNTYIISFLWLCVFSCI